MPHAGLGKDFRRICSRYNFWTVFRTISTLRKVLELCRVKDKDPALKASAWHGV
jgi:hypothetical protein